MVAKYRGFLWTRIKSREQLHAGKVVTFDFLEDVVRD
jgi:hypothetical protein